MSASLNGLIAMFRHSLGEVRAAITGIGQLAAEIDITGERLQRLHNAGDQVSDVVRTIAEIADQTNLLAVRTQQSTVEINAMLATIVQSIQSAVAQMGANRDQAQDAVRLANALVDTLGQGRQRILALVEVSQQAADIATDSRTRAAAVRGQVSDFAQLGGRVSQSNAQVQSAAAKQRQ